VRVAPLSLFIVVSGQGYDTTYPTEKGEPAQVLPFLLQMRIYRFLSDRCFFGVGFRRDAGADKIPVAESRIDPAYAWPELTGPNVR